MKERREAWNDLIGSFHHSSTLCRIPLRLITKSFVLVSKGTISRALASSLECCCVVDSALASPWLWLPFVLWSRVSTNSWRAASQFSWKVLKEVFSYTPISPNSTVSIQNFSQKTVVCVPITESNPPAVQPKNQIVYLSAELTIALKKSDII